LTADQGLCTFGELQLLQSDLPVKLRSSSALRSSDSVVCCREVFFESNGVPRAVEVVDRKSYESDASRSARRPARDKADPLVAGSVAAPMGGEVIDVKVKPGVQCCHRLCHPCKASGRTCPESAQRPALDKLSLLLPSGACGPQACKVKVEPERHDKGDGCLFGHHVSRNGRRWWCRVP
jgi:hypothetical protein